MALTEHPLRRELVREMHLRRFAPVEAPCRIVQMVYLVADEDREEERLRLAEALPAGGEPPGREARHAMFELDGGRRLLWEKQTEATTVTAISGVDDEAGLAALTDWLAGWPGLVVRATKLFVEADEASAERRLTDMAFEREELVTCRIKAGARIWSDFRIREDGFGRLLIAAGDAPSEELGRIVQRIQELGNYRNLALLGLPHVRRLTPTLAVLEEQLAEYSLALGADSEGDDETLLAELSELSARLAQLRVDSGYRLNASKAYAQIAADRLESLEVEPLPGHQSLTDFTERRLVPAMRTCETFAERTRLLSERSGDAIALLNTRIDTRIKAQNLALLKSMDSTFNLQLRLQHLVEALSIVAASYYAIGLIAYMLKGAKAFPDGDRIDIALAIATPLIVLLFFALVSRIRKRFLRDIENS